MRGGAVGVSLSLATRRMECVARTDTALLLHFLICRCTLWVSGTAEKSQVGCWLEQPNASAMRLADDSACHESARLLVVQRCAFAD